MGAWDDLVAANPQLGEVSADVEALIVRAPDRERREYECFLVPIDSCYELVGALRRIWRGFDGGQDARRLIQQFFENVAARSRPAPEGGRARP